MLRVSHSGGFKNFFSFADWSSGKNESVKRDLARIGIHGVTQLAKNTPKDSGKTAGSWGYAIQKLKIGYRIVWYNTNLEDNAVIAILIQYGHGTRTGGYVPAVDFVNPTMRPLFGKVSDSIWEEVKRA